MKEYVMKIAWQKRGFMYEGKKVFEYYNAPHILRNARNIQRQKSFQP